MKFFKSLCLAASLLLGPICAVPASATTVDVNAFAPVTPGVTLSVTAVSARTELGYVGNNSTIVLHNTGAADATVKFGDATVTAVLTSFPIPAGAWVTLNAKANTYIAYRTASSTTTLVMFTGNGDHPEISGQAVTQGPAAPVKETLQSAAVASGNGTDFDVTGQASIALTDNCAGCSGGTAVEFKVSQDNTNFTYIQCLREGTQTKATSTTLSGVTEWRCILAGLYTKFRASISPYSAGTVTVTATASPLSGASFSVETNLFDGNGNALTSASVAGANNLKVDVGSVAGSAACSPDQGAGLVGSCTPRVKPTTDDPCFGSPKLFANFSSTSSGGSIITATSAKKAYICGIVILASVASNVSIIEGTGSSVCTGGTPSGDFLNTGVTAANGAAFAANGGVSFGSGIS
jgi:hypothetical protein